MASAAVPGIFPAVTLAAKNSRGERQAYLPTRKWVDGSVSDDLPAKRLARIYGVNHFLVSQTNPHVIPFVSDAKRQNGVLSAIRQASTRSAREWFNASITVMRRPIAMSPALTKMTNIAMSVVNQDYVGDINILPPFKFHNPLKLLTHRPVEEVLDLIKAGEKATWPKIEMIRVQTKISRTLEAILVDYEDMYIQRANSGSVTQVKKAS